MTDPTKRIAILTSGGDCAGLNAIIRAVVLRANQLGWKVFGIRNGSHGLLPRPVDARELTVRDVDDYMLRRGGTVLGTINKGNPFAYPMPDGTVQDVSDKIIEGFRSLKCEALIGIGGDGSLNILSKLAQKGGFNLIGIPKTIDNDLGMTETSIGFDTAVASATHALDDLRATAQSHQRVMILEVMGRDAGHIALSTGIAGGADVILIPEIAYSMDKVAAHIKSLYTSGRNYGLVVVSEAVKTSDGKTITKDFGNKERRYNGIGYYFSEEIERICGVETRVTILGHTSRGADPIPKDRVLAAAFGVYAVDLCLQGKTDRMVAWSNREVIDVPIADAIRTYAAVDPHGTLVKTARGLGICLGD